MHTKENLTHILNEIKMPLEPIKNRRQRREEKRLKAKKRKNK